MVFCRPVQMSCAGQGTGLSHSVLRRRVQGVSPRVSPTASRMFCTEISPGFLLSRNPPPGPLMDLMSPAFFSLKNICSRNSEETFSSLAMEPMEMGLLWRAPARLITARRPYLPFVVILISLQLRYGYIIIIVRYYQHVGSEILNK